MTQPIPDTTITPDVAAATAQREALLAEQKTLREEHAAILYTRETFHQKDHQRIRLGIIQRRLGEITLALRHANRALDAATRDSKLDRAMLAPVSTKRTLADWIQPPEGSLLRVGAGTDPDYVATKLLARIAEFERCELLAVGQTALYVALKGVVKARGRSAQRGQDLAMFPHFGPTEMVDEFGGAYYGSHLVVVPVSLR